MVTRSSLHPMHAVDFLQRSLRYLIWAAAVVGLVAAAALYGWWNSPEHRIQQFASAVGRGDWAGMLSLMDATEVQRLGLTPTKMQAMLADAVESPEGITLGDLRWYLLNDGQSLYNRMATAKLYSKNGSPLADARRHQQEVFVEAYNTDAGWKIGGSKFIATVLIHRPGYVVGGYRALCLRHSVQPEVFSPENGTWQEATGPR
jgi:hypothetical protein